MASGRRLQPRQSVKKKLQKMQKVLGNDVMNFATSSTDVDELNAITMSTWAVEVIVVAGAGRRDIGQRVIGGWASIPTPAYRVGLR